MDLLPYELWQIILDRSRHWEQVYLIQLCKYFNKHLKLNNLSDFAKRQYQIKKYYVGKFGLKTIAFDHIASYFSTYD